MCNLLLSTVECHEVDFGNVFVRSLYLNKAVKNSIKFLASKFLVEEIACCTNTVKV